MEWDTLLTCTTLTTEQQTALATLLLADGEQARVLGINPEMTAEARVALVNQQWSLLQAILPILQHAYPPLTRQQVDPVILYTELWTLWLPLARQMASWHQQLVRPLVVGILGGQGTGKTTLGWLLRLILSYMGYVALSLSLDDLYKSYADRQQLQRQDPRLIWRGPPGTHDVALGIEVLDQLRAGSPSPVAIPRFDKSAHGGQGDRMDPEFVRNIDIVLFEGWFVGVQPVDPAIFDHAPEPIVTDDDRRFARDMNDRLQDYLPLWQRLDRLLVMHPVDFHLSQQWRQQAEQQRIAAGGSGMTDYEIQQFVTYFWKALHPQLFITPLTLHSPIVNIVMEIQPDHRVGRVYSPTEGHRLTSEQAKAS